MSRYQADEEVRQEYVRDMGSELGQLFYELFNDLSWLHMKWKQYRDLFGTNAERIELLNSAAPLFVGILQRVILDDVILHLARLTDWPKSSGRDNLTVRRLPDLIGDEALRDHVESALSRVMATCVSARKWRNRRIAHSDLSTIRAESELPGVSRQDVEEALAAFRVLLNTIEQFYRKSKMDYGMILDPGGAESLVYYIEKGIEAEEAFGEALLGRKTSPI